MTDPAVERVLAILTNPGTQGDALTYHGYLTEMATSIVRAVRYADAGLPDQLVTLKGRASEGRVARAKARIAKGKRPRRAQIQSIDRREWFGTDR